METPRIFRPILALLLALVVAASVGPSMAEDALAPDLVLTGELTGADHQTWITAPFQVPAGIERITVEFAYTGR